MRCVLCQVEVDFSAERNSPHLCGENLGHGRTPAMIDPPRLIISKSAIEWITPEKDRKPATQRRHNKFHVDTRRPNPRKKNP